MFGFGKKKKKQNEAENKEDSGNQKGRTEKLVMGAIIGVAVGSVVGISINQKNKHESNEDQKSINPPKDEKEEEPPKPRSHLGKFLRALTKNKKAKDKKQLLSAREGFKKIPTEWD